MYYRNVHMCIERKTIIIEWKYMWSNQTQAEVLLLGAMGSTHQIMFILA